MLDPRTHQPRNSFQLHDQTTNRHRTHHSTQHDTWESNNPNFWPSRPETESSQADDESGMCSPPLWTTSPPHGGTLNNNHHYRSLSPNSRTQAIVKGQRELMDMVKNMPESNYELSLKDLVEHHRIQQRQDPTAVEERKLKSSGGGGSGRNKVPGQVKRSGSIDRGSGGGFYLKMGLRLPFNLGSRNNKKNSKKNKKDKNESSKVSPRPSAAGSVDKEWWKKSPLGSKESVVSSSINSGSSKSSGSTSSTNSTSSTSNSRNSKSGGRCWSFIPKPKRQTRK